MPEVRWSFFWSMSFSISTRMRSVHSLWECTRSSQRQLPLVLAWGPGCRSSWATWAAQSRMRNASSSFLRLVHSPRMMLRSNHPAGAGRRGARQQARRITGGEGYPYFIQAWGYGAWNAANKSPISKRDVEAAEPAVLRNLDESSFEVRFDRLTPTEKRYLRAMAKLGAGRDRFGRHCRDTGGQGSKRRAYPKQPHQEGHDLQSRPWRYGLHCAAI